MNKAIDFLEIQKQALSAESRKALGFIIVNQTHKILPYKQAIFWTGKGLSLKLACVSGNASIDEKGPYALWLKQLIKNHLSDQENPALLTANDMRPEDQKNWNEWCAKHGLILRLYNENNELLGGVWIEREENFKDQELALLEELQLVWSRALAYLQLKERAEILSWWKQLKKRQKYFWVAIILLTFFPVRLNVTAPAEIAAEKPMIASVPYNGILKSITVSPGDTVQEDQIVAEMEREELLQKAVAAEQALKSAKASLSRLSREALAAPEKKADINLLKAEIKARQIEYDYAQTMLERSEIKAPRSGVAIFSDVNELQGKPVATGESVMEIAAPDDIDLLIRIPVDALIPLSKSSPVTFYPNVSPLNGLDAQITTIGYQASADPDGLLTYKVRASLAQEQDVRIGWKGTAKIYGDWTILGYSVLRRPLIALRRLAGG